MPVTATGSLHSMQPEERALALEVLADAWQRLARVWDTPAGQQARILGAVRDTAARLPERHAGVAEDYAYHAGEAAVWYLDRAVRRVGDPDRDGHTSIQRAANLAWYGEQADAAGLERLFALACALNADDQ